MLYESGNKGVDSHNIFTLVSELRTATQILIGKGSLGYSTGKIT